MLSRRELLKMGMMVGGSLLVSSTGPLSKAFADSSQSPTTTPFLDTLAFPPVAQKVVPFASPMWDTHLSPLTASYYHIITERRMVQMHSQLPPTEIWGYRDINTPLSGDPAKNQILGPTLLLNMSRRPGADGKFIGATIVRHEGDLSLPARDEPLPFGEALFTAHQHGGHVPGRSDGYPTDPLRFDGTDFRVSYERGTHFDYLYPLVDPGFTSVIDPTERPSTMWYHDHIIDFTGPNVYRGLAGFFLVHEDPNTPTVDNNGNTLDVLDTGDENTGLRLPSGSHDVPLVLQDKIFDSNGQVVFDPLNHDGFLGDKFLVNGVIQPRHAVDPRRYRFRFLNGSNARFYFVSFVTASGTPVPMNMIASEGGLFSQASDTGTGFQLGMAERIEVMVDFRNYKGQDLYLVNRQAQDDGRGPRGTFEQPELVSPGTPLLKLTVGRAEVTDNSLPAIDPATGKGRKLRPFAAITSTELAKAYQNVRTFKFERTHGLWAINGQLAGDISTAIANPPLERPEIWRIVNSSGGWWHPIHIHSEFGRVITRKDWAQPPFRERDGIAKKDTIILGPGSEVDVFFKFRDFRGPFVFHCHNIEHEDHAMMARFDVAEGAGGFRGSEA